MFGNRMAYTYIDQVHIFPFLGFISSFIHFPLSPQPPVNIFFSLSLTPFFYDAPSPFTLILISLGSDSWHFTSFASYAESLKLTPR